MLIGAEQLRLARKSCGLSQGELAEISGLARNTVTSIESGAANYRAGTMALLMAMLISKGAVFRADGEVQIRMKWEEPKPADAAVRAEVLRILNAQRKSRGEAPFVDEGE